MAKLRRTKAGPFTDKDLITLHDLTDAYWFWKHENNEKYIRYCIKPVEFAVQHIPKVWVVDGAVDSICNGIDLKIPGISKFHSGINKDELGKDVVFYHGTGCNACGRTGYHGRLPIFEFLVVDKEIREELISGASEAKIRAIARKKGYHGLLESGISRVLAGLTTAEEVLNATFIEKE